jgi:hypothetical protein
MSDTRLADHDRVKANATERALDLVRPLVERARACEDVADRGRALMAAREQLFGFLNGWLAARPDDYTAVRAAIEDVRRQLDLTP